MDGDFTWRVKNFTQITERKIYSEEFEIGTYTWRLLLFPRGNQNDGEPNYIAVYLDFAEVDYMPALFSPNAHFLFVAVNQKNKDLNVMREATQVFTKETRDWGFTQFLLLSTALNAESGFIVNDTFVLTVKISVRPKQSSAKLARQRTGFVGLTNIPETCHANSVLQFLYHIPLFRKMVYQLSTRPTDPLQKSTAFALQKLFFKLQYQDSSVSTDELLKLVGFGEIMSRSWEAMQNFRGILFDRLAQSMEGTPWDAVIQELFVGHYSNHIECQNVDYKSSCKEQYMEIDLEVENCRDVYESLERFCKTERLEGANKFDAEHHGLQDALRSARFDSFPPILQLQLKRLRHGQDENRLIKNNAHYKIHEELDLDCNDRAFLSESPDRTVRNKYRLHSVFTHTGAADGGTYGILIRSNGRCYRFENEIVTEEPAEIVISEYSGGEEMSMFFGPLSEIGTRPIATSLFYIRCSDWDRIMCNCGKEDIENPIRRLFEAEVFEEENLNKEREDAHLCVVIKLVAERHFWEHIGFYCHFNLADFNRISEYRLHKKTSFEDFKKRCGLRVNECEQDWKNM